MIIEMMPYRDLTKDKSRLPGIQDQVFATEGEGETRLHAYLHFTSGTEYWRLKDLGFNFETVYQRGIPVLHGTRPRGRMSLVGIQIQKMSDVQREMTYQQDRLRFPLSHQSEPTGLELPDQVVALSDWKPGA